MSDGINVGTQNYVESVEEIKEIGNIIMNILNAKQKGKITTEALCCLSRIYSRDGIVI